MLAALAAPARADVASLRLGAADGALVSDVRLAIDGRVATLRLTIATHHRDAREIVVGIDVPHGGAVTEMAMIEASGRSDATWLSPGRAREEYTRIVDNVADPALLEYAGGTRHHDHLQLSVFPVAKVAPVTIELTLGLPETDALAIEPIGRELPRVEITAGAQHAVWRHVATPREVDLLEADAHGYDPLLVRVDRHRSLYAQPQATAPAGTLAAAPPGLRSARQIRDVIRAGAASLAACGDVEPHAIEIVIAPDGRVTSVSAGSACIEDAIRGWKFPVASDSTRVAYPLSWYVAAGTCFRFDAAKQSAPDEINETFCMVLCGARRCSGSGL